MRSLLGRRGLFVGIGIVVMLAAAIGIAYAASTGDKVIVGCAKNGEGQLRIVHVASDCRPSEHAVLFQAPLPGPQTVLVDCAAGQTVTDALARTADAPQVQITIRGMCTEAVTIARDNVTLRAEIGNGLQAPSSTSNVLALSTARHIELSGLTLRGGENTLLAVEGAEFHATDLTLTGAPKHGAIVDGASVGFLMDSSVDGAKYGVTASHGGSLSVIGGTISNSQTFGVQATNGGSIALYGGVLVHDSGFHGAIADHGGALMVGHATVQTNKGTGVFAFQGGSVFVQRAADVSHNDDWGVGADAGAAEVDGVVSENSSGGVFGYNGGRVTIQDGGFVDHNFGPGVKIAVGSTLVVQGATITRNFGGIQLEGTSSASFGSGNNTIRDNLGWGIVCAGPPAVAQISAGVGIGTVTGNLSGQIRCPTTP